MWFLEADRAELTQQTLDIEIQPLKHRHRCLVSMGLFLFSNTYDHFSLVGSILWQVHPPRQETKLLWTGRRGKKPQNPRGRGWKVELTNLTAIRNMEVLTFWPKVIKNDHRSDLARVQMGPLWRTF